MSINSIGSASGKVAASPPTPAPHAAPVKKGGSKQDGDADDGAASAVKSPPSPSVNTSGQTTGKTINTTA